jgi:hypothetical protein
MIVPEPKTRFSRRSQRFDLAAQVDGEPSGLTTVRIPVANSPPGKSKPLLPM